LNTASHPQWKTSSRLLKLGEAIDFDFYLPDGMQAGDLTIFPRYLEIAQPGEKFEAGGGLDWLDELPSESRKLTFDSGQASITVIPLQSGSYIARWLVGDEQFYRYFAVIEEDWTVLRFSTFHDLVSEPTLHGTGIPLDYRLPADRFDPEDELFRELLDYHRHFGDGLIPALPDTPEMNEEERLHAYRDLLDGVRRHLPFPEDVRSARVDMLLTSSDKPGHALDPGYTRALAQLGMNDHCVLWAANGRPYLGMPEFPY
jgi:hypothetical protein